VAAASLASKRRRLDDESATSYVVCDQIGKVYGTRSRKFEALRNVSFAVPDRQFVSLLGPSGCGKTTVLMMVGGLEEITTGHVTVDGTEIVGPRQDISIMFQDATLLPWKTALENVLFPIRIMRRPVAEYRDRAEELLRVVGLGDARHRKPQELSGGMRQRVALCRALIHQPRLLLMDEPFSALDAITRDEMNVVLTQMWDRFQSTALFVTHGIREAAFLSDRVIVMGQHPATVIADIVIDFARPREMSLNELPRFNELCGFLRDKIELAHSTRRAPAHPGAAIRATIPPAPIDASMRL
jgi:NitT/TauT family transport system ATP-binding protein